MRYVPMRPRWLPLGLSDKRTKGGGAMQGYFKCEGVSTPEKIYLATSKVAARNVENPQSVDN